MKPSELFVLKDNFPGIIVFSQWHKQPVSLWKLVWTQFDCISENNLENSELNSSTAERSWNPDFT